MIDGVVYKIYKDNNCYVGSTTNYNHRIINHKSSCNNETHKNYNNKIYKIIRENGGFNTFNHEILELGEYEDKKCLVNRERYFYELLKPNMNLRVPTRSREEYSYYNKEQKKAENKRYKEKHKEKINQTIKCDICGSIVREDNYNRHKKSKKCMKILEKNI